MKFYRGFDYNRLKAIASKAGNQQIKRDVEYAKMLHYHNPEKTYCEIIDDKAFIIAQYQKGRMRIVGLCTTMECRGQGLASLLLQRCVNESKKQGYTKITTRSYSGADYYARKGFDVVGIKDGDYLLELNITD
jgi:N-acetylglutamate synthase-like GNAT family acetyltransferase